MAEKMDAAGMKIPLLATGLIGSCIAWYTAIVKIERPLTERRIAA
jgi:hypothetical protein